MKNFSHFSKITGGMTELIENVYHIEKNSYGDDVFDIHGRKMTIAPFNRTWLDVSGMCVKQLTNPITLSIGTGIGLIVGFYCNSKN